MIAIAVDDELPMLLDLVNAVKASPDITQINSFSSCNATLEWVAENPVDIAFLDINMRGMGGLALAEKLQEQKPNCKIVFCTGYSEIRGGRFPDPRIRLPDETHYGGCGAEGDRPYERWNCQKQTPSGPLLWKL